MPDLLRQTRTFLLPYLLLLALVGGLVLATPKHTVFFWINGHHAPALDPFFRLFTNVGDGLFYVLVCLALLWVRFGWALLGFVSFVATSLVADALKYFVFTGHPRPVPYFAEHPGYPALHLVAGVVQGTLKSFPSGHTTSAFSVFLLLTWLVRRKAWGCVFLALAALAAYSRVYLAQHFVEDVVGGSILGTGGTLALLAWLPGWLRRHPRRWYGWRLRGRRLVRE